MAKKSQTEGYLDLINNAPTPERPKCKCGQVVGLVVYEERCWCPNCLWKQIGQLREALGNLLAACEELTPVLREPLHWRLLVPGERKLVLRIEAAIAKATQK